MTRLQPSSFLLLGTFWFPETRLQPSSFILFFVAFWFPGTWLQPSSFLLFWTFWFPETRLQPSSFILFFVAFWFPGTWLQPSSFLLFWTFWFPETRLQPSSFFLLWRILIPWGTITAFFFFPSLGHSDSLRHDYSLLLFSFFGAFWLPETRLQPSSFFLLWDILIPWDTITAFFSSPSLGHSDSLRHDYSLLLFSFFGAFWFREARLQPSSFIFLWSILIPWDTITTFYFSPSLGHSDSLKHDYSLLLFSLFVTFWFPETRLQPSSFLLLWGILIPWGTITALLLFSFFGAFCFWEDACFSFSALTIWGITQQWSTWIVME